jgi:hypothetical protein
MHLRTASLLFLSLAPLSCAVYSPPVCRVGADCASGVCNADGTCALGTSGGTGGGASTGSSGTMGTGGAMGCSSNGDGIVTRQEVPLQPGLHATFRAAENAGVSTAGTMNPDGSRTWDLSVTFSGDHAELVQTLPLSGQWFGMDFPGASYAARLADSADLLGVFTLTDAALQLSGVASPQPGATETEVHYNPPVTVLSFPLQAGGTWSTTSMVTGQAQGVAVLYAETYQSSVDAHGLLKTPYAAFQALRVNTLLTRVVGAVVTTTRTYAFITDCFGDVASIVSNTDELAAEFATAAEVTRLAP